METGGSVRLMNAFVGLPDLRRAKKACRDLVEMLVVAVCPVLAGAGNFVEIEEWAKEKLDCFRQYLRLGNGIRSYDTFDRVFATIDTMGA